MGMVRVPSGMMVKHALARHLKFGRRLGNDLANLIVSEHAISRVCADRHYL